MLVEAKKKGVYKKLIKDFLGPNRLPIEDSKYTSSGIFIHIYRKPSSIRHTKSQT